MSNTINWGKIYEKTAWGIGVVTNTISWGKIYANLAGLIPSFALNFANIVNDFTFTRSSFATRVNEFGLIETVTDLGNELIDYSAIGSPSGGWSLVNGKWFFDDVTSGHIETENFDVVVGEQYEVTVDVTISSGDANFRVSSGNAQTILFDYTDFPNGVTKFVTTVEGIDGTIYRLFAPTSLTDNPFTLNSISIKKVLEDDVPRIDYSTGEAAFLLEPQSTNLLPYSEDFSQSDWSKQSGVTATYNTTETLSPDGTYNATKLVGDGTTGILKASISVSGIVSRSVYLKSVTGTTTATFKEPNTGVPSAIPLTITNEWQRFEMIGDNGSSSQGLFIDDITSDGLYIWGAQVEALPYATSYIPTNGSIVTRSAETCVDATPTINSEEGVLYVEASALVNGGVNRYISLSDGTSLNRVQLYFSSATNNLSVSGKVGDVNFNTMDYNSFVQTDNHKIAFKYSSDGVKLFVDGAERASNTDNVSFPIGTLTDLDFSFWNSTSLPFYGNTKDLKIYDKALTDEELLQLTTI